MRTLVIVPTYNESENLERLVSSVLEALPSCEVLVVDDASPDGTGRIADTLTARDRRVHVMHRPGPRGRGLAGRDGYLSAIERGVDGIIEMDADFSHDPALLPRFVEKLQSGADVVLGSRFVPGGSDIDRGFVRRVITVLANGFIRLVLGLPVRDPNSGYRAFRRAALERIHPATLVSPGTSIVQEVLHRSHSIGLSIVEIPIQFVDRREGESKLGLPQLLDTLMNVLRLRIQGRFRGDAESARLPNSSVKGSEKPLRASKE